MTFDDNIRIETGTPHDYEAASESFADAMLFDAHLSESGRQRYEPGRSLLAREDDVVVGTASAYTRTLSIPGAVVPAAHVTRVAVQSTHRRKGVLSRLMKTQLRSVPEALCVLWATEPQIYGRFGYGPASWQLEVQAQLHRIGQVSGPRTDGRLRQVDCKDAIEVLSPIHAAYQRQRPGVSGRDKGDWRSRLDDPSELRHGMTQRKFVVYSNTAGEATGYATWRGNLNWDDVGPAGKIVLEELVATDLEAYTALWRYVLSMDLAATVNYRHMPVDAPVRHLVANPRAFQSCQRDALWLRIVKVPEALSQRAYAVPVDLVVELSDDVIDTNNGRFRLTADSDSATCVPTEEPADLSMSVKELGAIYLGGTDPMELAHAGAIEAHTPQAVERASAAFGWHTAPCSAEVF